MEKLSVYRKMFLINKLKTFDILKEKKWTERKQ